MSQRLVRLATKALPLAGQPPAFAAEAGGFVHVLAADARGGGSSHITLDRDGAAARPADVLPLSLVSAAGCGAQVVAVGVRAGEVARSAIGVAADGTILWETPLPVPARGLVWVVPACVAGEPAVVWEVEGDAAGELSFASVRGGRLGRVITSSQPGVAYGLHVAARDESLFVLRSRGSERPADILRLEGGEVAARSETSKNAQALATVGERLAVLSWTTEALLLQWLDSSLAPLGGPETIASAAPPSWIRYATLHTAGEDRVAVSYLVGETGGLAQPPGARSEPGEYARHFLGRYDAASHALEDLTELAPAGTAWLAGAWLGDRLLFARGATGAALSVFELERQRG
jgi:hypothetical protein